MRVRDWMTQAAPSLRQDCTVEDAWTLMQRERVEHIPVLDDEGRLVGMLDPMHLVSLGLESFRRGDLVRDVMAPGSLAIHPDAPITAAASILRSENRTAVPVAEGGFVMGVFTRAHVLAALAATRDSAAA